MTSTYIDHILSRVRGDISFLAAQNVISSADADLIEAKLVMPAAPTAETLINSIPKLSISDTPPSPIAAAIVPPPARVVPPRPPSVQPPAPMLRQARALWTYTSQDPADINFREGEVIEVLEELSPDWWKGRVGGRIGMFPANYVEKISTPRSSSQPPAYTSNGFPPRTVYAPMNKGYPPPPGSPPSGSQIYQQQQQYPQPFPPVPAPQQQAYQPPFLPQQQQQQPAPAPAPAQGQDQQPHHGPNFGKIGSKLGDSLINGVGWGAGTAIGSDLVHAIF